MESPLGEYAARYLNNDEAAAFLRLSPRTLDKQRAEGDGPRYRKVGRRVIYAIADLEAWIDALEAHIHKPRRRAAHR